MQTRLRKTGLTASIAIIALSVILAVGSTFSLFTSNDGNDITISSATVKVTSKLTTLETYSLGKATETAGKFDNFGEAKIEAVVNEATNVAVDTLKITNMTPGDEARVTIDIENTSTVRIAYRLKVTVDGDLKDALNISVKQGDVKLALDGEYTQWAYTTEANNEIKDLSVSVLLPTDTDNTYQTKNATVKFAIEAVQANAAELVTVTTADQLYAALETNGEAILLGDITLTDDIIVKGNAAIDLNGYALTGNIVNKGNLIIKDSKGAITADAAGTPAAVAGKFVGSITNNGTLTITGGSFANDADKEEKTAIITNGANASLTIENADFVSEGAVAIDNDKTATLVIESGSFVSTVGEDKVFPITYEVAEGETETEITISGGSFSGEVPEEILPDNLAGAPDENGNFVVSEVIITAGGKNYSTLQYAVEKAEDEIKLLKDITLDELVIVPADRNVTIDLNGNDIYMFKEIETTTYAIANLGTLTLKDSIGTGSINSRGIYNGYDGATIYPDAKITVVNGIYNALGTNGGAAIFNYGTATIQSGTFTSIGGYSLNSQSGSKMTIETAIVTGGIYNVGELTINDGNIQTNRGGYTHAIYSSGGSLEINGGNFSGNGNEVINANNDVATINGGTFQKVEKTSYLLAGTKMIINGGTFNAYSENGVNPAAHPVRPDVTVKGGTFNYKHGNIAEGAIIVDNGNGTWTVYSAGDTIVMNAGTTLDLGGVAFDGYVKALGDLTIKGKVSVKNISLASSSTITIGEGACLELTGTDRMVIGHGVTFNITGTIADAKTADKATIQPSLIFPGASFTGAGVTFNVKNAYLKTPTSYASSSKSASGIFDFNIENSIWELAGKLAFESQSTAATVNFELKNSVLTTGSHLVFGLTKGEVVIDNSLVNVGISRQLENQSTMTIKNGSVVNGAVAASSNAKNPGTLIVENATYDVTGEFTGSDLGIGTLIIKKDAIINIGSITKANIVIDANAIIDGTLPNFTANLSKFAGEISFTNGNMYEAAIDGGKIVVTKKPVASVGGVKYDTLEEAFKAVTAENSTIEILTDAIIDYKWDARNTGAKFLIPVTINGNGNTITFTGIVNDGYNYLSAFRFEADATINNLTIDMTNAISEFGGRFRAISAKGNLTVNGCTFIGNGSANNTRAIVFGESAGANTVNLEISITNSTFKGWRRAISDNENAQDVKTVYIANNKFDDAGIAISANEAITVSNNVFTNSYVNITSYTANNALNVTATGNTLTENADTIGESTSCNKIVAVYGDVNAQDGFIVYSAIVSDSDKLAAAIQKVSGGKIYLKAGDYTVRFSNNTSFNVDNITLIGIGDVTLSVSSSEAWYGRVQGSNVTFENIHFTSTVGATGKATYNNCTFDSWAICASSNNEKTYYNNCTINGCLNTSTDFSSGDVYAENCVIEKAEYSGSMTMYFENCTINELISWDAKTVLTGCTVTTLDDSNMSNNEIVVTP